MPFAYAEAPTEGALRQGEVLGPLWDHRASYPPIPLGRGRRVAVRSTLHDLRIVLSPDCDLLWDYEARFDLPESESDPGIDLHPSSVNQVLVCDLQSRAEMRLRFKGNRDGWRRVDQNQDARYHHLLSARVGAGALYLHDLFLDFKKVTAVP